MKYEIDNIDIKKTMALYKVIVFMINYIFFDTLTLKIQ